MFIMLSRRVQGTVFSNVISSVIATRSSFISITRKLDGSPCYNVIDVIPYTDFGFQSFPLPSAGVKSKRSTSKLQTNYKPLNTGKIANFENCGINLEQEKYSPTHHRRKQCSQKFDELILSNLPDTGNIYK